MSFINKIQQKKVTTYYMYKEKQIYLRVSYLLLLFSVLFEVFRGNK